MTSIERTAFPRFSKRGQFNKQWLYHNFSLRDDDYKIIERRSGEKTHILCLAVQLKVFQYLGYFLDFGHDPLNIFHYCLINMFFQTELTLMT